METLGQIAQKINIDPGRLRLDEPMRLHTSFRIGGPADLFLEPADLPGLSRSLEVLRAEGVPTFVIGGGANLLVGDRGLRGAVVSLERLDRMGPRNGELWAEAGTPVDLLCEECLALGRSGLEDFYGMPGSLGGSLFMNARCYEKDFSAVAGEILAISPQGRLESLSPPPASWSYKASPFQRGGMYEGWVIAAAALRLGSGDGAKIAAVMRSRRLDRTAKGHYAWPSAGSMFKNDRSFGRPTGAILDALGFRGRRIGDAAVSPLHANIFVNLGRAKASDVRALVDLASQAALEAYGFKLEPEVRFVGEF